MPPGGKQKNGDDDDDDDNDFVLACFHTYTNQIVSPTPKHTCGGSRLGYKKCIIISFKECFSSIAVLLTDFTCS